MPARVSTGAIIAALTTERGLVYRAARALRCSPDTIYRRIDADPKVRATIEHCRGMLLDTAEARLADAVESGEPWAVSATLKLLGHTRGYTDRPGDKGEGDTSALPTFITIRMVDTLRNMTDQRIDQLLQNGEAADLARMRARLEVAEQRLRDGEKPLTDNGIADENERRLYAEHEQRQRRLLTDSGGGAI